jgi:hypothetical protein
MRKQSMTTGERLMDLRTAVAYLGCSYWTLRDLALNEHVPVVRIRALARLTGAHCVGSSSIREIWTC